MTLLAAGCGGAQATGAQVTSAQATGQGLDGAGCQAQVAQAGADGELAFVRNRGVSILRLPSCRTQVLLARSNARAPLRFSGDGRYLAFGHGTVISADGDSADGDSADGGSADGGSAGGGSAAGGSSAAGSSSATAKLPLGRLVSWAWSPQGAQLAGVTQARGIALWSPGAKPRQIVPAGWGASSIAYTPSGTLIVVRETQGLDAKRPNELWAIDPHTDARRLLHRLHGVESLEGMTGGIAGFTPNGQDALFWSDVSGSASIAADGLPLDAVPLEGGKLRTLVPIMLPYDDYIADCGSSLLVATGRARESNVGKTLALLSPPTFKVAPLRQLSKAQSWTTPSCSAGGEIATAAGPSRQEAHFGLERRAIWLLSSARSRPQRLTSPAPNVTDELPRIAANGRYILFIKTETGANGTGPGTLELLDLAAGKPKSKPKLVGPIAQLGSVGSYYGHYPWAQLTAWHPGR
ncbi:MAG TPA: hypothetical protein VGF95_09930 [Solirubrobacteraceae bacterium]